MKLTIVFLSAILFSATLTAQIVFTQSNWPYQPGITYTATNWEGEGLFDFSTSGTSNVWDFAMLSIEEDDSIKYGSIPFAGSVCESYYNQSTNMVMYEVNLDNIADTAFFYCTLDSDEFTIDGDYFNDGLSDCEPFFNGMTWSQFPFSISDFFTDTYAESEGNEFSATWTYVAAGSIELPMGYSYSNVALLQFDQDGPYTQYNFFAAINGVLCPVFYVDSNGLYEFRVNEVQIAASTRELEDNGWALINSGQNNYSIQGDSPGGYTISIIDVSGRLLKEESAVFEFDLSSYETGIYIISVNAGERRKVFKLQKS